MGQTRSSKSRNSQPGSPAASDSPRSQASGLLGVAIIFCCSTVLFSQPIGMQKAMVPGWRSPAEGSGGRAIERSLPTANVTQASASDTSERVIDSAISDESDWRLPRPDDGNTLDVLDDGAALAAGLTPAESDDPWGFGPGSDCNANGIPDDLDIFDGFSDDCNENLVPDECEGNDCNGNDILDECEITLLNNGDFEYPDVGVGGILGVTPGNEPACFGWRVDAGSVEVVEEDYVNQSGPAFDGHQFLDLDGTLAGTISQIISTVPGEPLELSFSYANNYGHTQQGPAAATVTVVDESSGQMLAGPLQISHGSSSASDLDWTPGALPFMPTGNSTIIRFTSGSETASLGGIFLDGISTGPADLDKPNLVVTGFTLPESGDAGQLVEVRFTVENMGNSDAIGSWTDHVAFSDDNQIGGDSDAGTADFSGTIAPGTEYEQVMTITLPVVPGHYHVVATTDVTNAINEGFGESGNTAISLTSIEVLPGPQPDLSVMEPVQIPAVGLAGQAFAFQFTVRNEGAVPAVGPWRDRVYFSTDNQIGGDDAVATLDFSEELPSMGTYQRVIDLTLPGAAGTYYAVVVTDVDNELVEGVEGNNASISVGAIDVQPLPVPDLVLDSVSAPTGDVTSGQSVTVSWTLRNAGAAATSSQWVDEVFISNQPGLSLDPPNGDQTICGQPFYAYAAHVGNLSYLGQGSSYTQTALISIPPHVQGSFYVYVVADRPGCNNVMGHVAESNDVNNLTRSASSFMINLQPQADLVVPVETLSLVPSESVPSGANIAVRWTTHNGGGGATSSGSWVDAVYLSLDSNNSISPNDILLGQKTRSGDSLGAGQSDPQVELIAPIPGALSGPYFVKVWVDRNNTVSELANPGDENNNITASDDPINITPSPNIPDLGFDELPVAETAGHPAHPIIVTYTARNDSADPLTGMSWVDRVYLSTDSILEPETDYVLGSAGASTVFQNSQFEIPTYARSVQGTLPQDLEEGEYYVIVQLDASNQVFEGDGENNNVAPSTAFPVTFASADLRFADDPPNISVPESAAAGQPFLANWEVTNDGEAVTPVTLWRDAVYLSDDQFRDPGDTLLAQVVHFGALEADSSYSHQAAMTIPHNKPVAAYFLLFVTDSNNEVFENAPGEDLEDNNLVAIPFDVTPVEPTFVADLEPLSFQGVPATTAPGQSFSVDFSVSNTGNAATTASAWVDRLYLSTDSAAGSEDYVLGSIPRQGALGPFQEYGGSSAVTIPAVFGGQYYLILKTDALGQVFEAAESNNSLAMPIIVDGPAQPAPNLTATNVSADSSLTAGQALSVSWRVSNLGNLPTGPTLWRDSVYLSLDSILGPGDVLLGTYQHQAALNENQWIDVPPQSFPTSCAAGGTYRIIVQTDSQNEVWENNSEADNVAAAGTPTQIMPLPQPNLRVEDIVVPESVNTGQTLTVSWRTTNTGNGPTCSSGWVDAVFLSRDLILDNGNVDHFLGVYQHTAPLADGEWLDIPRDFVIPAGLSGPYFVLIKADAQNQVAETIEVDNTSYSPGLLQIAVPAAGDMIVSAVGDIAMAQVGEEATFIWEITNNSPNEISGSWSDSVFLSTDAVWDIKDAFVARFDHGPTTLPGGMSIGLQRSAAIPPVLPDTYHIFVRSDVFNQIPETDNNNNTGVSSGEVTIGVQELVLDGPAVEPLLTEDTSQYYMLNTPPGETVKVTLDHASPQAWTELLVRRDELPTPGNADFSSSRPDESSQTVFIPTTEAGTYYILARATANTFAPGGETATIQAVTVPFAVSSVMPPVVGNGDRVSLRIEGSRFSETVEVELRGPDDFVLVPDHVTVVDGLNLRARFNLSSAPFGPYDLALRDAPGAPDVILSPAIEVEPAQPIGAVVTGSGELDPRAGTAFLAHGTIINTSNVDAPYVTLLADFSGDVSIGWDRPANSLPRITDFDAYQEVDWQVQSPTAAFDNGRTYDAFYLRDLGPGETVQFSALVTDFVDGAFDFHFNLHAGTYDEFASNLYGNLDIARLVLLNTNATNLPPNLQNALTNELAWFAEVEAILASKGIIDGSPNSLAVLGCQASDGCVADAVATELALGLSACPTFDPADCTALQLLRFGFGVLECQRANCDEQCEACGVDQFGWQSCSFAGSPGNYFGGSSQACGEARGAIDPNEKIGPSGGGSGGGGSGGTQQMVSLEPIPYTIHFENVDGATAHAATIRITDQLDTTHNIGSVRFGDVRISDVTITALRDRNSFVGTFDLTEEYGILLNVVAGVDASLRQAYWIFESIDPVTGQPPTNPNLGILPVNDDTGIGTGYVELSARSSSSAATGSPIRNGSSIQLDQQQMINTNIVEHILDADRPTSAILAIPETNMDTTIPLTWTGSDPPGGSGLAGFTIFVQIHSSPSSTFNPDLAMPIPSLVDTTEQVGSFSATPGRWHRFFSIARDNAGNKQPKPSVPAAHTYVPLRPPHAVTVLLRTAATVNLNLGFSQNPTPNPYDTQYAVVELNSGQFLGPNGRLQTTPHWRPSSDWPDLATVRALEPETEHQFAIRARNAFPDDSPTGPAVAAVTQIQGDVDGNGVVDPADTDLVEAALGTVYGDAAFNPAADLNGDDQVSEADLAIVDSAQNCPVLGSGDFDNNGVVDLTDVQEFVDAILNPTPLTACIGDVSVDGNFNGVDVAPFVRRRVLQ